MNIKPETGNWKTETEYGDIDSRVAAKLRAQRELEARGQQDSLLDAYRHGLTEGEARGRALRWADLGFAFFLGALAGLALAALIARLSS